MITQGECRAIDELKSSTTVLDRPNSVPASRPKPGRPAAAQRSLPATRPSHGSWCRVRGTVARARSHAVAAANSTAMGRRSDANGLPARRTVSTPLQRTPSASRCSARIRTVRPVGASRGGNE